MTEPIITWFSRKTPIKLWEVINFSSGHPFAIVTKITYDGNHKRVIAYPYQPWKRHEWLHRAYFCTRVSIKQAIEEIYSFY